MRLINIVTVVISECIANCIDCQSSGAANCASTGCVGARYYTTTPSPSCASKSFKSVQFLNSVLRCVKGVEIKMGYQDGTWCHFVNKDDANSGHCYSRDKGQMVHN